MLFIFTVLCCFLKVSVSKTNIWQPDTSNASVDSITSFNDTLLIYISNLNDEIRLHKDSSIITYKKNAGLFHQSDVDSHNKVLFISDELSYQDENFRLICYENNYDLSDTHLDCQLDDINLSESLKNIVLQIIDYKKISFIANILKSGDFLLLDASTDDYSFKIYAGHRSKRLFQTKSITEEPILLIHRYPKKIDKNFTEPIHTWHTMIYKFPSFGTDTKFHSLFLNPKKTHIYIAFTEEENTKSRYEMARIGRVCIDDPGTQALTLLARKFDENFVTFRKATLLCRIRSTNGETRGREIPLNKMLAASDLIQMNDGDDFLYTIMSTDYPDSSTNQIGICIYSLKTIDEAFLEDRHYIESEPESLVLTKEQQASSMVNSKVPLANLNLFKIQTSTTITKQLKNLSQTCENKPLTMSLATYSSKFPFLISSVKADNRKNGAGSAIFAYSYLKDYLDLGEKYDSIYATSLAVKKASDCFPTRNDILFIGLNSGHVQVIESLCNGLHCINNLQTEDGMKYLTRFEALSRGERVNRIMTSCTVNKTLRLTIFGEKSLNYVDFNQYFCKTFQSCSSCQKSNHIMSCSWNDGFCGLSLEKDDNVNSKAICVDQQTTIESSEDKTRLAYPGNWMFIGISYVPIILISFFLGVCIGRKYIGRATMHKLIMLKKRNYSNQNTVVAKENIDANMECLNLNNDLIQMNNFIPAQRPLKVFNRSVSTPDEYQSAIIDQRRSSEAFILQNQNVSSLPKNYFIVSSYQNVPLANGQMGTLKRLKSHSIDRREFYITSGQTSSNNATLINNPIGIYNEKCNNELFYNNNNNGLIYDPPSQL